MKRMMMVASVLFVFIFASACSDGNQNGVTEPSDMNNATNIENDALNQDDDSEEREEINIGNDDQTGSEQDEAKNQDDMKEMMKQLDFYEFELEVEYGDDKEFEVELEHHSNGDVEAEVEDELNDNYIDDDLEAFNYIYPKVKQLNISKDMDKADVIDQVLKAFGLSDDYEEFEVEFEFEDGTELEIEDER